MVCLWCLARPSRCDSRTRMTSTPARFTGIVHGVQNRREVLPVLHRDHVRVVHDEHLDGGEEVRRARATLLEFRGEACFLFVRVWT